MGTSLIDFPPASDPPFDVRVLIVEDEAIIAHDVASMLEELGYSVSGIASTAEAAFAFAERETIDIVLLDIRIKGELDGIDVAYRLKERHRLPVVYMTAHTDDVTLARARATEPFGYIAKPLTSADIKVALSIALLRHRIQWQADERESSLQTAVEHLEQARHQSSRCNITLTSLTDAIANDLKPPLQVIGISASLLALEDSIASTHEGRAHLNTIKEGCRRLDTLMTALLDYFSASCIERKGAQPMHASDSLRRATNNLSAAIKSSAALIEAANLPSVLVHPTALMLIFQNLLANSIKFAGGRAPLIHISAERQGEFWQFTIKDNGLGFDPAQSSIIFDLFKRAHSDEYAGTGLGLALCRRLVEEHGGTIWAESQQGKGSQFHFTIPAWLTNLSA